MKFLRNIYFNVIAWIINRYEGAAFSVGRSTVPGGLQDARADISKSTREELVRKSRYFEKNSALLNKLCDTWEQYTVGTGLQFYATSTAAGWNALADGAWERWKPFADVSSRFGFDNLQGVISRSLFVDGEVFVILTRGDGNRPRIQILEGPLCKTPDSMRDQEGKTIVDGIEIDPRGRPIRYWFEMGKTADGKAKVQSFEAFAVVHIFEPSRPGQLRGIPYISCAINTLHDLDDLQMLEMGAAKLAGEIANVETNPAGELSTAEARRSLLNIQTPISVGGTMASKVANQFLKVSIGARNIAMPSDGKIENFQPMRPTIAQREFWTKLEEQVCAGVGIPRVLVYPDSMQGTVYRGALDCANAFFRSKSAVLATYFRRIREFVLNAEGSFYKPLASRPFDWTSCDYLPPAAVNTDIGYNSQAAIAELAAGIKSWDDILLPQGRKAEPVLRRKAALTLFIKKLAKEFSRDGFEVQPEEIASLNITPIPDPEPDEEPVPVRNVPPE